MSENLELPAPVPSPETEPYWAAAREQRLGLPRCGARGGCWVSERHSWVPASGRGTVFSFVVYHRVYHRAFKAKVPYVVAVIELEEGPRLISNVVGIAPEQVRCDMPVRVVFEDIRNGFRIPQFAPLG